MVILEARRAH